MKKVVSGIVNIEKFCRLRKNAYLCRCIWKMGRFQSGQMGQTVNLLRHRFGGSNPSLPTVKIGCVKILAHPILVLQPCYASVVRVHSGLIILAQLVCFMPQPCSKNEQCGDHHHHDGVPLQQLPELQALLLPVLAQDLEPPFPRRALL